jgi:hypothetical protein
MHFYWPWNSLRQAYASWQALENRRLAAWQKLERRYLDLRRLAESVPLDPDQGVLRAARLALDQPLDPLALQARRRLDKAFAILGKSFFRRTPAALEMESRHYASHIEALCHKYEDLGARLVFAQKIIALIRRNPALSSPHDVHLALISPEAAWLFNQLREKRLAERRARESCLARGWRARITTAQRWLGLLQDSMPSSTFRKFDRSLKDLAEKAAGAERQEAPKMLADHVKLDLMIAVAHRQATRNLAGLLLRKTN